MKGFVYLRMALMLTIMAAITATGAAAYNYYGNTYGSYGNTYGSYGNTYGGYGGYQQATYRTYNYNPVPAYYGQTPVFTGWQARPSGYGLVQTRTPYPMNTPRYENNLFLGHRNVWDPPGVFYSGMTGQRLPAPAYRPTTYAHMPSRPYDPYRYYPEW